MPRRTILLVDDDPLVGGVIARALKAQYDVSVVETGAAALELLEQPRTFDVILCDLMMPEMTGMQLHEEIARRLPAQARRMVFMTGGAFTDAAQRFLGEPGRFWLEKPLDWRRVDAVLATVAAHDDV